VPNPFWWGKNPGGRVPHKNLCFVVVATFYCAGGDPFQKQGGKNGEKNITGGEKLIRAIGGFYFPYPGPRVGRGGGLFGFLFVPFFFFNVLCPFFLSGGPPPTISRINKTGGFPFIFLDWGCEKFFVRGSPKKNPAVLAGPRTVFSLVAFFLVSPSGKKGIFFFPPGVQFWPKKNSDLPIFFSFPGFKGGGKRFFLFISRFANKGGGRRGLGSKILCFRGACPPPKKPRGFVFQNNFSGKK